MTELRRVLLTLTLELELADEEKARYILADPQSEALTPQIGFLADLFDLFNFEADLGVVSINGLTHTQIRKTLGLP